MASHSSRKVTIDNARRISSSGELEQNTPKKKSVFDRLGSSKSKPLVKSSYKNKRRDDADDDGDDISEDDDVLSNEKKKSFVKFTVKKNSLLDESANKLTTKKEKKKNWIQNEEEGFSKISKKKKKSRQDTSPVYNKIKKRYGSDDEVEAYNNKQSRLLSSPEYELPPSKKKRRYSATIQDDQSEDLLPKKVKEPKKKKAKAKEMEETGRKIKDICDVGRKNYFKSEHTSMDEEQEVFKKKKKKNRDFQDQMAYNEEKAFKQNLKKNHTPSLSDSDQEEPVPIKTKKKKKHAQNIFSRSPSHVSKNRNINRQDYSSLESDVSFDSEDEIIPKANRKQKEDGRYKHEQQFDYLSSSKNQEHGNKMPRVDYQRENFGSRYRDESHERHHQDESHERHHRGVYPHEELRDRYREKSRDNRHHNEDYEHPHDAHYERRRDPQYVRPTDYIDDIEDRNPRTNYKRNDWSEQPTRYGDQRDSRDMIYDTSRGRLHGQRYKVVEDDRFQEGREGQQDYYRNDRRRGNNYSQGNTWNNRGTNQYDIRNDSSYRGGYNFRGRGHRGRGRGGHRGNYNNFYDNRYENQQKEEDYRGYRKHDIGDDRYNNDRYYSKKRGSETYYRDNDDRRDEPRERGFNNHQLFPMSPIRDPNLIPDIKELTDSSDDDSHSQKEEKNKKKKGYFSTSDISDEEFVDTRPSTKHDKIDDSKGKEKPKKVKNEDSKKSKKRLSHESHERNRSLDSLDSHATSVDQKLAKNVDVVRSKESSDNEAALIKKENKKQLSVKSSDKVSTESMDKEKAKLQDISPSQHVHEVSPGSSKKNKAGKKLLETRRELLQTNIDEKTKKTKDKSLYDEEKPKKLSKKIKLEKSTTREDLHEVKEKQSSQEKESLPKRENPLLDRDSTSQQRLKHESPDYKGAKSSDSQKGKSPENNRTESPDSRKSRASKERTPDMRRGRSPIRRGRSSSKRKTKTPDREGGSRSSDNRTERSVEPDKPGLKYRHSEKRDGSYNSPYRRGESPKRSKPYHDRSKDRVDSLKRTAKDYSRGSSPSLLDKESKPFDVYESISDEEFAFDENEDDLPGTSTQIKPASVMEVDWSLLSTYHKPRSKEVAGESDVSDYMKKLSPANLLSEIGYSPSSLNSSTITLLKSVCMQAKDIDAKSLDAFEESKLSTGIAVTVKNVFKQKEARQRLLEKDLIGLRNDLKLRRELRKPFDKIGSRFNVFCSPPTTPADYETFKCSVDIFNKKRTNYDDPSYVITQSKIGSYVSCKM